MWVKLGLHDLKELFQYEVFYDSMSQLSYLPQGVKPCGLSEDRPSGGPFCGPRKSREVGHIHIPCSLSSPCHADAVGRERLSLSWFTSWESAFVPEAVPTFPTKDKSGSSKAKVPTVIQPDSDPPWALPEAPCGTFLGAMPLLHSTTLWIPPVHNAFPQHL